MSGQSCLCRPPLQPCTARNVFHSMKFSRYGCRIGNIARIDRNRHRPPVTVAKQSIVDLRLAAFAITAVSELSQGTASAFEVTGAQIIQHQIAVAEKTFRQQRDDKPISELIERLRYNPRRALEYLKLTANTRQRRETAEDNMAAGSINTIKANSMWMLLASRRARVVSLTDGWKCSKSVLKNIKYRTIGNCEDTNSLNQQKSRLSSQWIRPSKKRMKSPWCAICLRVLSHRHQIPFRPAGLCLIIAHW